MKILILLTTFLLSGLSFSAEKIEGNLRSTTPPLRSETEEERFLRLESFEVTPDSYQKDIDRNLPRLTGEDLESFKLHFDRKNKHFLNRKNGKLKYGVNYFLHSNGNLYAMPFSYAEEHGYQHSSFDTLEMTNCIMAGEFNLTSSGVFINEESGHYKPQMSSEQTQLRIKLVIKKLKEIIGIDAYPIKKVLGGF